MLRILHKDVARLMIENDRLKAELDEKTKMNEDALVELAELFAEQDDALVELADIIAGGAE